MLGLLFTPLLWVAVEAVVASLSRRPPPAEPAPQPQEPTPPAIPPAAGHSAPPPTPVV